MSAPIINDPPSPSHNLIVALFKARLATFKLYCSRLSQTIVDQNSTTLQHITAIDLFTNSWLSLLKIYSDLVSKHPRNSKVHRSNLRKYKRQFKSVFPQCESVFRFCALSTITENLNSSHPRYCQWRRLRTYSAS